MKLSRILKLMLAAALPLYAIEDEAASGAPSSTEAAAIDPTIAPAVDAAAGTTDAQSANTTAVADVAADVTSVVADAAATDAPAEIPVTAVEPEASDAEDAPQSTTADSAVDASASNPLSSAPVVQTPTPVAEPGNVADPVLDTVKTPAHNVAEEIQEQIKKLEELPAEVAAWFESKFVELASHIKALL